MQSPRQHEFARIEGAEIPRSSFNRSFNLKTSFDSGLLIPVLCDEALPGDTINLRMTTLARLATPIHPVLDNMYLDSFFFAVPMRLLWDNWAKFCGEQDKPGDSISFTIPQTTTNNSAICDYMGIPPLAGTLTHSAMWLRAYNLIYNEWFRSEDLIDSVINNTGDGPDTEGDYTLLRRTKRHDYFTSCLPWPQKGTAVSLPLGSSAVVTLNTPNVFSVDATGDRIPLFQGVTSGTNRALINAGGGNNTEWTGVMSGSAEWDDTKLDTDIAGALGTADLTGATAATINAVRQSFQIQRLLERDARAGTRYTEIVRSHFGVVSSDQRLQRPEYLGGGVQPINVTPVPQTSSTDGTSPQGNLAAYGISSGSMHSFSKSFNEHCIILGLVHVRADIGYQQGLERQFSRLTRYDFYWPALSHIGEQAVLNKEIYAQGSADLTADAAAFGYQERWSEYRYKPSLTTSKMRSTNAQSLDTWHLAEEFTSLPVLNATFINHIPPIDRIIAVPAEPHFLFDAFFDFNHARPMPTRSTPGLIDHF